MERPHESTSKEVPKPPDNSGACTRKGEDSSTVAGGDEAQRREVADRVKVKADLLRQLNMVKVYRNRAETRDLDDVTAKWLEACQEALEDLFHKVKDETGDDGGLSVASLGEFIDKLNIDHTLVKFDKLSESFLK